ncbi:MAG: hypothetical protein AB1566_14145 [Chloroflexota bacterium]
MPTKPMTIDELTEAVYDLAAAVAALTEVLIDRRVIAREELKAKRERLGPGREKKPPSQPVAG